MIETLRVALPYISGLWTLPWIIVGFVVSALLGHVFSRNKIDLIMKKAGLVILYFFIPPLVFRIFLDTPLGVQEAVFVSLTCASILLMYLIAWNFALYHASRCGMEESARNLYLKTVLTNQGRSSAFVGGAMLAVPDWGVPAGIFMALVGIALFAVLPHLLCRMSEKESGNSGNSPVMPGFLRIYPWYFYCFVLAAVALQKTTGINTAALGDFGVILRFYTALTIPMALYYVGAGMHPGDFKVSELKKLIGVVKDESAEHWMWVRQIILLTSFVTPLVFAVIFGLLYAFSLIPWSWFAVTVINTTLPITSTNMFLVSYGLDKKATAHSVTWSTLIGVPMAVGLIWFLGMRCAG